MYERGKYPRTKEQNKAMSKRLKGRKKTKEWRKKIGDGNRTHGLSDTKFYFIWNTMRDRCTRKTGFGYKNYGGRGIKICKKWLKFNGFKEDMYDEYLLHKKFHKTTSIERIDNNGPYSKKNCRWATRMEQMQNTRSSSYIEFGNKKQTISQWAKEIGLRYTTLWQRIFKLKWSVKDALTIKKLSNGTSYKTIK